MCIRDRSLDFGSDFDVSGGEEDKDGGWRNDEDRRTPSPHAPAVAVAPPPPPAARAGAAATMQKYNTPENVDLAVAAAPAALAAAPAAVAAGAAGGALAPEYAAAAPAALAAAPAAVAAAPAASDFARNNPGLFSGGLFGDDDAAPAAASSTADLSSKFGDLFGESSGPPKGLFD